MRFGLYGGSFDPVHHGHLILAREAMEQLGLARVIFLPARLSPHKLERPPAAGEARWQMLLAAIEGEEGFEADARELRRSGPSYAIETVRELEREHSGVGFDYFIGEDNLRELGTWKEIEELRRRVRFVVFGRGGELSREMSREMGESGSAAWPWIERQVEISSTEIRNRIARGLSVRYLMPEMSFQILQKNSLYGF